MKTIAISQPRYLPAVNYFQRIQLSDVFVILDTVQHQRRSFEHRNRYKVSGSSSDWLSIPIDRSQTSRMTIRDMHIQGSEWVRQHQDALARGYREAPHFDRSLLDEVYGVVRGDGFVENIQRMNEVFCRRLGLRHSFVLSSSLRASSQRDRLLADIVRELEGKRYLSGPNGRDYISREVFGDVELMYHDFDYPVYDQGGGNFLSWMCIWDPIFYLGIEKTRSLILAPAKLSDK